jgi:hypothetical protein
MDLRCDDVDSTDRSIGVVRARWRRVGIFAAAAKLALSESAPEQCSVLTKIKLLHTAVWFFFSRVWSGSPLLEQMRTGGRGGPIRSTCVLPDTV